MSARPYTSSHSTYWIDRLRREWLAQFGQQLLDASRGTGMPLPLALPASLRRVRGQEGSMGAGVTADDVTEGILHRLEEHVRHAGRRLDPQRVPEPGGVFDGRPLLLAGDVNRDQPTCRRQLLDDLADVQVAGAEVELVDGEGAEIAEEVHHRIGVAGGALVGQSLQLHLD